MSLVLGKIVVTRMLTDDGRDVTETVAEGEAADHLVTALGMLELAKGALIDYQMDGENDDE